MARFLHIVPDDKFIDGSIAFHANLGGSHRWVSLCGEGFSVYTYIRSNLVEPVGVSNLEEIVKRGEYDVVVFHTLYFQMFSIVLLVPDDKILIWNSWGADIYYNNHCLEPLVKINLYKRLTKKYLIDEHFSLVKRVKRTVKDILFPKRVVERNNLLQQKRNEQELFTSLRKQAISRINFCSTILETEYKELVKLSFFSASFFPYKYVGNYGATSIPKCDGDFILVGNSRDPSNNHLDVLEELDKKGISNKRIVPLSYGDPSTLSVLKKRYGHDKRVLLITDFLSRAEYYELLNKCKIAIFGHMRQQAIGNINRCLRQGSKVFFYKESMAYKFYIEKGVTVFSIEEDLNRSSVDDILDNEIVVKNTQRLADIWNYPRIVEGVKEVLGSAGILI